MEEIVWKKIFLINISVIFSTFVIAKGNVYYHVSKTRHHPEFLTGDLLIY